MPLLRSLLLFLILIAPLMSAGQYEDDPVKSSLVKIFTVFQSYSYLEPWNESVARATGSGCIIEGNRILTNAHVVANQTYIEIQKYGERKRYRARVLFISHQADLALLGVEDEQFFDNTRALEFDALPYVQQEITVYGFPTGGNTLSVTKGIVSRIEHHVYTHSGESFLAIQVDAAINPGNSGGPALSDGKIVGVVMQGRRKSQSIGYLVPVPIIRHFLDDIRDGSYDGFPEIGILSENLESPSLKAYSGIGDDQTGQLVLYVTFNSEAQGKILPGDILTSVDGHAIQDDGTVEFRKGEFTPFKYYLDRHQIGETAQFGLLRKGKQMNVDVKLTHQVDAYLIVDTYAYDSRPRYYIFGGYVFSPLNANLLRASKYKTDLRYFTTKWPTKERQEIVVLLKVLASELSVGNYGFTLWPVDKIDGKVYSDFNDFISRIESSGEKFVVLENSDGIKVAIEREKALEMQPELLKRYNIAEAKRQ